MFKRFLSSQLKIACYRNFGHMKFTYALPNKIKTLKKDDTNLTTVLRKTQHLELQSRPVPKISTGEVLLAIDCVGISHSDLTYWKYGRLGPYILEQPMVLGHEASGIVTEVGENVNNLVVGDRVAIEPGIPCRKCTFCRSGRYNLCTKMNCCGTPPVDGVLTHYFKHAADFCYALPQHISMEEGALLSSLASGCAACRRANIKAGMHLLIIGAGPIGLATLMVAQSLGINSILILDKHPERLCLAQKLGATRTVFMSAKDTPQQLAKRVVCEFDCMPDCTIDCCGTAKSAELGMLVTRSGGVFTLVIMTNDCVELPLANSLAREVDVLCVFRFCNDFSHALALIVTGKVNLKPLATHHFTLENSDAAFELAYAENPGTMKVLIHVQPRDKNNLVPFEQENTAERQS